MALRRTLLQSALVVPLLFGFLGAVFAQEAPVKLGFAISKTGMFAPAAQDQLAVYQMWKDQINAQGGVDLGSGQKRLIEFVEYDDQSKPEMSVRLYEKLISQDKVDLLLAPWGMAFHIALTPVLEKYKFPMVGNTAASVMVREVKPGYIWFPTTAIPDRLAVELVALMKENNIKSAVVLSNIAPYSKELKKFVEPELKTAGIDLKFSTEYPPDIKDMTSILTQIKEIKPDAVLALAYPADALLYERQGREIGVSSPFQFVAVGPSAAFYRDSLGTTANGTVTIGHWSPDRPEWKGSKKFYDDFVARYKREPDYLDGPLAYVSLEILEQAVKHAGLDKEKLRQAISTKTFETINGPIKFDGVENAVTPTALLQIQEGKLELIWPERIATKKFQPKAEIKD